METHNSLWMKKAIGIGEKGRVNAPPNPWVGCVIVKNGQQIGTGFHPAFGHPHAEIYALKEAGSEAKDSTVFVTLEPCAHQGKTPPCVEALIAAKVSKVVIGIQDPDTNVAGKGISQLRDAGIQVTVGVCKEEMEESLAPYIHHRTTGRPYVILKLASSIDGRLAANNGSSQWISCPEARGDTHRIRAESQAILVGSSTYMNDQPQLTVRHVDPLPERPLLKVILDRRGRIQSTHLNPCLIFSEKKNNIPGIEVVQETRLKEILKELGARGVVQLLVEGGSNIASSFLKENFVNELIIYTGPKILGSEGIPLFQNLGIHSMDDSVAMTLKSSEVFGSTVKTRYDLTKMIG